MQPFLAAGVALALACGAALAQERQALLIGNQDYRNAPAAETAARDVRSVADRLRAAGWQVSLAVDATRDEMRETLERFATGAAHAEEVLIYYSGHALRSDGRTYLAPVDQTAGSVVDVMLGGVPLDLVLRIAALASGEGAVFIDGARLEGFEPTPFVEPGLAAIEAPQGVVVISAAPPGQAIRRSPDEDSPFARTIVGRFLQPGAEVVVTAGEVGAPIWVTGKLEDGMVLAPAIEQAAGQAVDGDLEKEIELAYWRTADRSGRDENYRAYLARYPDGIFAGFARERLGQQPPGQADQAERDRADPAAQAEQAMALDPGRIRQVQQWLRATGFEPGSVDGVMGPNTREALRGWQRAQGLTATGYLSSESLDRLSAEGAPALAEQQGLAAAADDEHWAATGARGTEAGFRAYLRRYPQGAHASEARAALAGMAGVRVDGQPGQSGQAQPRFGDSEGAQVAEDPLGGLTQSEAALRLNARDRQSLEQRLRALGFEPGPIDGQIDARARAAIGAFQASRGMRSTGQLDRQTVVGIVQTTNQSRQDGLITEGTDVVRALIESLDAPQSTP